MLRTSSARLSRRYGFAVFTPAVIAASASAGFTTISPPTGLEPSHAEVFQSFYGGSFVDIGGGNFGNGDIFALRVEDTGNPGIITLETGDETAANDEFFAGNSVFIVPRRSEAMDETGLGLINGDGSFTPVAQTADIGVVHNATLSGVTRFALVNNTTGAVLTSSSADNADLLDHMVMYKITSKETPLFGNRWVIMFEDRLDGELGFDRDFNDAVFEIIAVPAPASALGLAALAIPATRRRRA